MDNIIKSFIPIIILLSFPTLAWGSLINCNKSQIIPPAPPQSKYRIYRKIYIQEYDHDHQLVVQRSVSSVELYAPKKGKTLDRRLDHFTEGKYKSPPFALPLFPFYVGFGHNKLKENKGKIKIGLAPNLPPDEKLFKLEGAEIRVNNLDCSIKSVNYEAYEDPALGNTYSVKILYFKKFKKLLIPQNMIIKFSTSHFLFLKHHFVIHLETHIIDTGEFLDDGKSKNAKVIYQRPKAR